MVLAVKVLVVVDRAVAVPMSPLPELRINVGAAILTPGACVIDPLPPALSVSEVVAFGLALIVMLALLAGVVEIVMF